MARVDVPAPMTGTIKEILCLPGDRVTNGQEVIILESMKMEIPIESPQDGTVLEIVVQPGQPIEEGALLLVLEG